MFTYIYIYIYIYIYCRFFIVNQILERFSISYWLGQINLDLEEFVTQALPRGFPLESVWHQVSRTFLTILADLNNMWTEWSRFFPWFTNRPEFLFSKSLEFVLSAPTTIGITTPIMFHGFFSSRTRWGYLSVFALFYFHLAMCRNGKIY